MIYRDCEILPSNSGYTNFEWSHKNYDGAPDSPTRHLCGYGRDRVECMENIDLILDGEDL